MLPTEYRLSPRVIAWIAVVGAVIMFATVFDALVTRGLAEPVGSPTVVARSPAAEALSDGDDVRALYLLNLRDQGIKVP